MPHALYVFQLGRIYFHAGLCEYKQFPALMNTRNCGVYCFLVVFPQPQSFLSGLHRSLLSHRSEGTPLQISEAFRVALSSVAVFSTNFSLLGLLKLIYFLSSQRPLGSLWVPQPCHGLKIVVSYILTCILVVQCRRVSPIVSLLFHHG